MTMPPISQTVELATYMRIPNDEIHQHGPLRTSVFGLVYEGDWKTELKVAIKTIQSAVLSTAAAQEEFAQEINIMSRLRHRNIQLLFGCVDHKNRRSMIMEYSERSLKSLLNNDLPITWKQRWQIGTGIAAGLNYIHSKNLLHLDLKSSNILITKDYIIEDYIPKITDFGLSQVKLESNINLHQPIDTFLWMLPEAFKRGTHPTEAFDIYSLGIVLWEVASREKPWAHITSFKDLATEVLAGKRPPCDSEWPLSFRHIIQICWQNSKKQRPKAKEAHILLTLGNSKPNLSLKELHSIIDPDEHLVIKGIKLLNEFRNYTVDGTHKAFNLFEAAAKKGHPEGIYQLGLCYELGKGVERNMKSALLWYSKGDLKKHAPSSYRLGLIYTKNKEDQKAAIYFKNGADQEHPNSEWMYGLCCFHGRGIAEDKATGILYIKNAATHGFVKAAYKLGLLYLTGSFVKKDMTLARTFLGIAIGKGYLNAKLLYSHNLQKQRI